jgi:predicted aspartyl protease
MRLVFVAGVWLLLAASAAADHSTFSRQGRAVTVPFELDHGHIFVQAYVNGKGPYRFGFDTGASGMGRVDASLTSELSLQTVGAAQASDGVIAVTTDVVTVDRLQVGSREKRHVQLISRDYNKGRKPDQKPILGIIGRDFLADALVTIDYPARTVTFAKGALRSKSPGVVAYGESFVVPVCFASGCYPAKIDTGSNRSIVLPKSLVDKVIASEPTLMGQVRRTNGKSNLYEMELNEPVKVAGITASVGKIMYADPSDAAINVGSDFLKNYVLTIDQRHHLLRISKPRP